MMEHPNYLQAYQPARKLRAGDRVKFTDCQYTDATAVIEEVEFDTYWVRVEEDGRSLWPVAFNEITGRADDNADRS
jgi:hypothetical protein